MRNCEEKMIEALREGKNVGIANTMVIEGAVYLHGNKIAHYDAGKAMLWLDACGWHTTTTRSRLDALCVALDTGYRARIKNGVLGLDNVVTGERVALPAIVPTR